MMKRLFSMFLAIVMVVGLLSGLALTAYAGASSIKAQNATYYESGALKSIDTTYHWDTASVYTRLVLMTQRLRSAGEEGTDPAYGDFTDFGYYDTSFTSFEKVLEHDAANGTFGIITYSDEEYSSIGNDHTVTFDFANTDIPLSKNQTYYVYLWTQYYGYCFPDNLFAVIKVQDGAVQYTEPTGRNSYDDTDFEFVKAAEKFSVKVIPAANMSCAANGGAEVQTDLDVPMTPVAYAAELGYYFPEDYQVESVNGIKVTRVSENEITVSGMPTADTEITLTAPTKKQLELEEMSFLYAYDVQRNPTYPKSGDSISMDSLTFPLVEYGNRGTTNEGTWTLTKIGTYSIIDGTVKDSTVLQTIVDHIASNYDGMTAANVVIHELKDNGKHIAYGVTVAYDKDKEMAVFIGDTWHGSGAGYLLTTQVQSGSASGTADTDVTDWVAPTTYKVEAKTAEQGTATVSMTETVAGDTVTVTVTPANGYSCTGIEVKTASGASVPVTPVTPSTRATAGNQWTFTMPAENVTVTASYQANVVYHTVIYRADGKQVKQVTVEHGKDVPTAEVPVVPAKTGYDKTAPYWDHNGQNITANTTINAVYTINTYTVTYVADNKEVKKVTVNYGADVAAADVPAVPAKTGYTGEWDTKEVKNVTSDVTVTAKYTINKYTVTYKVDGKVKETQIVEHGKDAKNPAVPEKKGYTGKWSHDGKNITEDTTIIAVYATNPFTGDESHVDVMGTMMLISLMAAAFMLVYRKSFLYQGKYER